MSNYFKTFIAAAAFAVLAGCAAPEQSNSNNANGNRANSNANVATSNANNTNHSTMDHSNMNHGNMNHGGMNHLMMDHSQMQSSPNAASAPYDLQFLDTMIAHHQGAVDMSKPALEKAEHAELKEFARNIIADQEREITQMKQWREQWYAGKPQAMNMDMRGMKASMEGMDMNKLNAAMGKTYDMMFLEMMVPHHQGAVTMSEEALQRAEHAELKQLARQIIASQEREIGQMNKWKGSWK